MSKIEQIQYARDLEEKKAKLDRKLEKINNNIEQQKKYCSHISVDLGYYGYYPSTGDMYRCLICGKGKGKEYFFEPEYIIHAENFLPQYDITDVKQCDEKFDNIRTLALGILKENPDMSREELTTKLNNLIQENISLSESQNATKLVKTKKPNK